MQRILDISRRGTKSEPYALTAKDANTEARRQIRPRRSASNEQKTNGRNQQRGLFSAFGCRSCMPSFQEEESHLREGFSLMVVGEERLAAVARELVANFVLVVFTPESRRRDVLAAQWSSGVRWLLGRRNRDFAGKLSSILRTARAIASMLSAGPTTISVCITAPAIRAVPGGQRRA